MTPPHTPHTSALPALPPLPAPPSALILAAGRGERMRPLTDRCPKPLLPVRGRPLIEWHLLALARAGVRHVVINTAWLEEQFEPLLGDGSRFGLRIRYSMEGREHGGALETAGGLATALPLLAEGGSEVFWVVAGDVFAPDFVFDAQAAQAFAASDDLARLWLVPNPPHHPRGDFALGPADAWGCARVLPAAPGPATGSPGAPAEAAGPRLTYSTIGLYRGALVAGCAPGTRSALRPWLDAAAAAGRLGGLRYTGRWADVGTPERLAELG